MIEIICGEKGTGKTKRIISLANGISDQAKGSMVFIDDDNSYMYDLGYSIRFINVTDYALNDPDMFLGFLCGLCASDFDLEYVFVDRFENVIKADLGELHSRASLRSFRPWRTSTSSTLSSLSARVRRSCRTSCRLTLWSDPFHSWTIPSISMDPILRE